ncbi:UDP-N-acetylmuramoyl-tripeptide--D-alanyl-D-alanine ligase [Clostridium rectalis]|uniref:UDP-N-acetylmuramoyl-tripeptide--D-alanyl-D- alanine ligase n=1 Tax=Clostridium rectalis TaxID=2040295 RepID=UPI000F63AFBE|nr:UDP-N-acetylmuramoyl-tripeptide--D-alanyl-D-alanine ligase [Clostridium rectalis]
MEYLAFDELVQSVDGVIIKKGNIINYDKISTDTRKIEKGSIFIALKGENFNGNDYVIEASKKGAYVCIVDELNFNKKDLQEFTSVIKVCNTGKALLDLAKYYRSKLNIKVVGITGSTGKTSTKDLTAAVLSKKYKVFKTAGNFNNEIGLPLMIFQLDKSYDIAVLEMGMSDFREIHRMAEAAKPDIALITNVGISHIENLGSRENILKAKMEITDFFNEENSLIINYDNDLLKNVTKTKFNLIRTGIESGEDFYAEDIILNEDSVEFKVIEKETLSEKNIHINIPGKHNILNALLAIACARNLKVSFEEIVDGLKNLEKTSMRLDIIRGDKFSIVDDCYNASPDSMKAAIDVLMNMKGNSKIAILGSMKELGNEGFDAHKDIGRYAYDKGVNILIALGEYKDAYKKGFVNLDKTREFIYIESYEKVIEYLRKILKKDDVILVKASRAMKLEGIVERLKNYKD